MQFRDLQKQYVYLKDKIDAGINEVLAQSNFIMGKQVSELEDLLSTYVGVKHCISCANGTDALQLALMAWDIGEGDAVFVPDFTFFSSGEVVSAVGATPVFVDIERDTYNISPESLELMIEKVISQGILTPKAIISVDLFGQPADYESIRKIAENYNLYVLEDSAQGFGGMIGDKMSCSFGDISTTSFFPAKPLGCYGDGGAIFTDNDDWAELLRSYRVHGKGSSKYDNVRIGMNSRLDTVQAAVLLAKFPVFKDEELKKEQNIAEHYTEELKDIAVTPAVRKDFYSSWAQYTIRLKNSSERDGLLLHLKDKGIPSMVYYQKAMHRQEAFEKGLYKDSDYPNTIEACDTVLSLPFHPYMSREDIDSVCRSVREYLRR